MIGTRTLGTYLAQRCRRLPMCLTLCGVELGVFLIFIGLLCFLLIVGLGAVAWVILSKNKKTSTRPKI
jgi:hypothetical protein